MARARVEQFLFDRQWRGLRKRARALGIRIVGDQPLDDEGLIFPSDHFGVLAVLRPR